MVDYPDINISEADWIDEYNFNPRYNIAPRSNAPVIRRQSVEDSTLVIHTMKWGIVPHWSKHEDLSLNTINARAENLAETAGMWANMKANKRCVVVCDGYFEWLKKGRERLPHFIRRKDRKLMILAGLYDSALLEGATAPLWTFTIVTTDAAPAFSWLHDRQPVVLSSTHDFEAWLDTSKGWHTELLRILKPGNSSELECFPVPKEVGKVGSNSASFIEPISQRKDGIEAMFAKQAAKDKRDSSHPNASDVASNNSASIVAVDSADGKTVKRAIDIDGLSSLSPGQFSIKKQKLAHLPQEDFKRHAEERPQDAPPEKRLRDCTSPTNRGGGLPLGTTNDVEALDDHRLAPTSEPSSRASASPQSRVQGAQKKSQPPIGGTSEPGSLKITAFFSSCEAKARKVRGAPAT